MGEKQSYRIQTSVILEWTLAGTVLPTVSWFSSVASVNDGMPSQSQLLAIDGTCFRGDVGFRSHTFLLTQLLSCLFSCSFVQTVCTFWRVAFEFTVKYFCDLCFPQSDSLTFWKRALGNLRKEFHGKNNTLKYCILPTVVIRFADLEFIDDFWHWIRESYAIGPKFREYSKGFSCWLVV